ncbi:MAG: DUF4363 family protein [Ruminococcaceae bacterium]|nr:DUF4363 family protein [Oscillospiraceae bacterium]
MKAFIAGVITLTLLITAVTLNAFLIVSKTDSILREIDALPDSSNDADCSLLLQEWEDSRLWIALTVHRENVDDIDDTLALLSLYIEKGNQQGYLCERTRLYEIVERLKKTESFSPSRIF